MSKPNAKSFLVLLSLTAATLLSACDPLASIKDYDLATDLCTDVGNGRCPRPTTKPDDLTPN